MAGSGLQELFELMYAPNAVVHMLAGEALARVVRAHLIIDSAPNAVVHMLAGEALARVVRAHLIIESALNALLLSDAMNTIYFLLQRMKQSLCSRNSDLQEAFVLYETLMNNLLSVH